MTHKNPLPNEGVSLTSGNGVSGYSRLKAPIGHWITHVGYLRTRKGSGFPDSAYLSSIVHFRCDPKITCPAMGDQVLDGLRRSFARPRMKVVLVGHSYLATENRKQLTHLSEYASIEVLSPDSFGGTIFNYDIRDSCYEGNGWRIRFLPKVVPPGFPEAAYLFRSVGLGLRRFDPDVIHVEGDPFTPFFIQLFICRALFAQSAKLVCTVKQNTYTERGWPVDHIKDFVARRLVPKVDRFIAVNQGVRELYQSRFYAEVDKIASITHLGVDTELFSARSEPWLERRLSRGEFLVGYCGRFVEYKGVTDLIDAVNIARSATGLDVRLVLLGAGSLDEMLRAMEANTKWLHVLDPVPHSEVIKFLNELDAFVMPSRVLDWHVEHDAHAILEAMSAQVPCIGSRSGAVVDVLDGAGLLVHPEQPYELALALERLVRDPELRKYLGEQGRARVETWYSLKAVSKKYAEVYREVLRDSPRERSS